MEDTVRGFEYMDPDEQQAVVNAVERERHRFKFKGGHVPASAMYDQMAGRITPMELVLLLHLYCLSRNTDQIAWASNRYLAGSLGLKSQAQVSNLVKRLADKGYLVNKGNILRGGKLLRQLKVSWTSSLHHPYEISGASDPEISGTTYSLLRKEHIQGTPERHGRSVSSSSPRQESTMGFHEDGPPTPGSIKRENTRRKNDIDDQFAKELRSICASVGRIQPMTTAKWANEFRLMREKEGKSAAAIQNLLDWFASSVKTLKAPTIVNARHFRNHFYWLQDLMVKATKTEIVVEEKVKEVVDNIAVFKHPPRGHTWQDVGVFAQTVCNAARDFRKKVWDFLLDPKTKIQRDPKTLQGDDFRMFRMAQELVGYSGIQSAHGYAGWWTDRVLEDVEHWDKWSGNLMSMAWDGDLNHKRFRQSIDQVVKDWGGPRVWDKLKEVIA